MRRSNRLPAARLPANYSASATARLLAEIDGKPIPPVETVDTVYQQRANGRDEFWTYSDGQRVFVSAAWALREARRGTARIVEVR